MRYNLVSGNQAGLGGGGVAMVGGHLSNNVIVDNFGSYGGAGVYWRGEGEVVNNTIVNNRMIGSAFAGAGIDVETNGSERGPVEVTRNIVVGNHSVFGSVPAIHCYCCGTVAISCNDLWRNDVDAIVGCDTTTAKTLTVDPMFCSGAAAGFFGPYSLDTRSPVAEPQSAECGHLGALPAECRAAAIRAIDWTTLKTLYR